VNVSTKISSFIEQVALKNDSDEGIEKIFKLRAKNERVGLTQKSLNDFTLPLSPIIKSNIGLTTSLVEGLHLILMMLNESVLEEDSHDMLLELTSEKSQLMENIRKSLVADNSKSVSEKQSLLIATGIFERVLWLVRQLTTSLVEEKSVGSH
jgi:phosphate:Na+ symporter